MNGVVDNSIYWDCRQALSYQHCFVYMILGMRGCGKSFSCKEYAIGKVALQDGKQFAYIRRTESDLERTNNKFFNDMYELFPNKEFKVVGNTYLCDGEIIGYAYALSTSLSIKSAPVPDVDFIIFDEFLIDPNAPYQRYLKEEVYLFFQLYESIARPLEGKKAVPVFLLANVYTSVNPWFKELGVQIPKNKKGITTNDRGVYMQIIQNQRFQKAKINTAFGRLVAGTSYEATSINSEFIRDDASFIIKPPSKMNYKFTLKVGGLKYGVSLFDNGTMFYVSESHDKNCPFTVTTILDEHKDNTLLLKGKVKNVLFEDFKLAYNYNLIRYESLLAKQAVHDSLWR